MERGTVLKILIIGGVAAGTKAAAKLLRENRSAQVKVLTKGEDISYAGSGRAGYAGKRPAGCFLYAHT